jgi:hypothetical protein
MQDDTEPNDAQDGSQALPDVTCNAGALTFMGTLDGAADFDWFGLSGVWPGNCSQEAQVTVNVGQGLEVCAYVDCNAPDMDFMCGGGSTSDTAPDGDQGCCNNDAVSFRYGCMGGDQDSIIAVSVTGASAGQCLDYSGDYQLVSGNFF